MSELSLAAKCWWSMHELPVTKSICDIVLRHAASNDATRVLSVTLEIGALSDLQREWLQRYFDHLSRGTVAEGARLDIDRVPAVFRCKGCQQSFEVLSLVDGGLACRQCQSENVILVSGGQYMVKRIEVI
jgi:hydrogenase nickel incorporation protein HypA/HybF